MKISTMVAGAAAATALTVLLTGCGSSGSSFDLAKVVNTGAPTSTPSAPSTPSVPTAGTLPPAAGSVGDGSASGAPPRPAPVPGNTGFGSQPATSTPAPPRTSSVPVPSAPVTYESVSFPRPYNCAESGTTYYTPPNIAAAMDVTVLVTSPTLARDLVIAAPNRAPRGISNASQWISASAVGDGVWRATYRTFVSLYEPHYTPVTIDALQASAAGSHYTIDFASPVSVTMADCQS